MGLAWLTRFDVHRLCAFAGPTIIVDIQRIKGKIRYATGSAAAALNRLEPSGTQSLRQLMEIPQPMMPLPYAGQTDILLAERRRELPQKPPKPGITRPPPHSLRELDQARQKPSSGVGLRRPSRTITYIVIWSNPWPQLLPISCANVVDHLAVMRRVGRISVIERTQLPPTPKAHGLVNHLNNDEICLLMITRFALRQILLAHFLQVRKYKPYYTARAQNTPAL